MGKITLSHYLFIFYETELNNSLSLFSFLFKTINDAVKKSNGSVHRFVLPISGVKNRPVIIPAESGITARSRKI